MGNYLAETLVGTLRRLITIDAEVFGILWLSLKIAIIATTVGALFSLPLAWWIHRCSPRWKAGLMLSIQTWLAVPTVIIGTLVYILISRRSPLGVLEQLYTPTAIIIGDLLLVTPLITTFLVNAFGQVPAGLLETAKNLGAGRFRLFLLLSRECRSPLLVGVCAGFGRAISEVGCAMMLGGNIRGQTRTMTTAIALEIGKGETELGLSLGILLLFVALGNAFFIQRFQMRRLSGQASVWKKSSRPLECSAEEDSQGLEAPDERGLEHVQKMRSSEADGETRENSKLFRKNDVSPTGTIDGTELLSEGKGGEQKKLVPIVLKGISVAFSGRTLFENLHAELDVAGGLLLTGHSGAGKTTLLRAICQLQSLDVGEIAMGGNTGALVFQRPFLFSGTVLENLLFGLQCRGMDRQKGHERAIEIAIELGLASLLDQDTSTLSGGEAGRVALGRALVVQPDILFLDEPFVHLDERSRGVVLKVLERFVHKGGGLLVVTHDFEGAEKIAGRHLHLENGKLIMPAIKSKGNA
ncbi:MAG: ABC transporter permease [Candidatus Ozemobacteraceae bacterium]